MTANREKKFNTASASASASGGTPNTSHDASKEAFTRRLAQKMQEKFNHPDSKLTEPRPASGKGI